MFFIALKVKSKFLRLDKSLNAIGSIVVILFRIKLNFSSFVKPLNSVASKVVNSLKSVSMVDSIANAKNYAAIKISLV